MWIFWTEFRKIHKTSNLLKIHPVGTELFNVDGRTDRRKNRHTDMSKLIVVYLNFTNAPQNAPFCGNCFCSLPSALTQPTLLTLLSLQQRGWSNAASTQISHAQFRLQQHNTCGSVPLVGSNWKEGHGVLYQAWLFSRAKVEDSLIWDWNFLVAKYTGAFTL
jgi:hypothetical protein